LISDGSLLFLTDNYHNWR